ncbi:MAG: polysaccharide chain length determinant protein (PEP-CTERM system associated) [Desulforhopalus sp.]|jgi:polysaccharide chain length determinant protein (PEP-CTERM system associated)
MDTQPPQGIDIQQIVDIILRRKAIIVSCILAGLTLGLPAYLIQPKTYQSTALLSYQQQSINPSKMSPDAEENIRDIVSKLSQIVQSRTNLVKIIKNEDLYSKMRENLPMEDVIINMRKHIKISPSRRGDTFSVTYEATNPENVAQTTNALASGFIEENLKYREGRASDTSAYTKDELEMAQEILDKKEAVMRDYKLKYYNEMPNQRIANMTRLASLQAQYQGRQESIQDLERTRVLVRDQIEVQKQILAGLRRDSVNTNLNETDHTKLQRLQRNLEILQQRYTDQHPKVKSLKKKIKYLVEIIAGSTTTNVSANNTTQESRLNFDSTLLDLQAEVKDTGLSIERIKKEKSNLKNHIEKYERWVGGTPVREAEWSSLTREYGQLKRHYDFLVSRNLQAGSALNLERKQKGSQFKIVDPAKTPSKPTKPDFIRIMGMALIAGAGLAGAIIVALEFLHSTFRNPAKLTQTFNIELICSVPHIALKKELTRSRIITAFGVFFFFSWGILLSIAMYWLWNNNMIIL